MIKKITLSIFVSAFVLTACKKDRTCTCSISRTGTSTTEGKVVQELFGFPVTLADTSFTKNVNTVQYSDKQMKKVTKKAGQSNCISYTQPYYEVTTMAVPASSFNLNVVVTDKGDETYDCKLK